jgi:hypothetical protein
MAAIMTVTESMSMTPTTGETPPSVFSIKSHPCGRGICPALIVL